METHGPCNVQCPECPRLFPNQKHLDYHIECHKVSEPLNCEICQKIYKTRATLKSHVMRLHQGVQYVQKTFNCIFCKAIFINKDELKIHRDTHSFEDKVRFLCFFIFNLFY